MKTRIFSTLTLVIALAGLLSSCSNAPKDKPTQLAELKAEQAKVAKQIATLEAEIAKENPTEVKGKAKEVVVSELAPRKFDHYVQTQGSVQSEENILVSAKTMGVVANVLVREGEMVSKGQTLAQIDNTLILKGIDELRSQVELANTVYARQKNLWDQKIGTEVAYLQAKTNKESMERRLSSMNEQNEMTKIKSPISGVVDALEVKAGQNISPGMPAARVVNNSDLKIMAKISEAYSTQIKKGDRVTVSFPDLDKTIEAKVTFSARNIDALSRTFIVEAALPSNADLRPNMSAIVKVIYETSPAAILVPINLVQNINGEKIVYVAEKEGANMVARKKVIKVSDVYDNLAEVEGLAKGEQLITVGFQGLNDGELIKI
jgi:membrane fusion protein (multidrug efflux system)